MPIQRADGCLGQSPVTESASLLSSGHRYEWTKFKARNSLITDFFFCSEVDTVFCINCRPVNQLKMLVPLYIRWPYALTFKLII